MAGSWYEKDIPSATTNKNKGGRVYKEPQSVKDVLKFKVRANPSRQLNQETAEYFGIRQETSSEDGLTIVASYYPSYNKNGQIIGFKKRDWTLPKEEKGHFTTVGTVKATNQLFGQVQSEKGNTKKELYFAEGEEDVYSTWAAMLMTLRKDVKKLESQGKTKNGYGEFLKSKLTSIESGITQQREHGSTSGFMTIDVVGLTCGAPNAAENVGANEKFVKKYDKVVLGLDNDHCTDQDKLKGNIVRGREAAESIASVLLSENIYQTIYPHESNDPEGFKDPRDFVLAKQIRTLAEMFTKCDNLFTSEKIIKPSHLSVKELRKKKKDGIPMRHMPKLFELTRGARTGELWTLTGPSGAGKSTIGREIEYDICNYLVNGLRDGMFDINKVVFDENNMPRLDTYVKGERVGIIRLEEEESESMNYLIAMDNGFDPQDFSADPEKYLTEEEHQKELDKWTKDDRIRIIDHFGSMPIKNLISLLKQLVFLNGCRWIILDHLSMLVSGLRTSNEVKELDIIMTELAAFCKQHDVFILAIAHMKRKDFAPPKDGDGNALPFWYPVRKEDLRGSAALEQMSWIVLGVEPEELPDRSRGRVRVVSMKNRPHKRLGIGDTLWMLPNGTFVDAADWEVDNGSYVHNGKIMHTFEESKIKEFEHLENAVHSMETEVKPTPLPEPTEVNEFVDLSTGEILAGDDMSIDLSTLDVKSVNDIMDDPFD